MNDQILDRKLGFIGLGRMGSGIAERLARHSGGLLVYDIDRGKRERFAGKCRVAGEPEEVFRSADVILLSLPGSPEVEDTMNRLMTSGVTDIAGKVVIDLSTSYPPSSRRIYEKMKAAGGDFLDSSLSGGPRDAREGSLNVMVGGDRAAFERCLPLYRLFSKNAFYVGASGAGNIVKLAGNFISILYTAIYAEIVPFVEKTGVDPRILYDIVSSSLSNNGIFQLYVPKMLEADFPVSFQLSLAAKDLGYMKRLFEEENLSSAMLDGAWKLFQEAEGLGIMDGDTAELVKAARRRFGMDPPETG